MAELKPCPFCGATQIGDKCERNVAITKYLKIGCYKVFCYKCGTSSDWYDTEKQAARAWNRMADNG